MLVRLWVRCVAFFKVLPAAFLNNIKDAALQHEAQRNFNSASAVDVQPYCFQQLCISWLASQSVLRRYV